MSLPEFRLTEIEPQLKRMKFIGSYYSTSPVPFRGTATIDLSTGQFVGTIKDVGQVSDIIGEKHEGILCFIKLYRRDSDGKSVNDEPINYEFQKVENQVNWQGFFEYGTLGLFKDRDTARLVILSMGNSLMSSSEFRQVTEEVSRIIGERRGELAKQLRDQD